MKNTITQKSETLAEVCAALQNGKNDEAVEIARSRYPFAPEAATARRYGPLESTRVFIRDGFIDRYSGAKLIFPPVVRLLSILLPQEFPYGSANWKTELTHPAYWEVGATIDHLIPVSRGGADSIENWVTTSMAHNSAKLNWTLEELGWRLYPEGDFADWDGLLGWFLDQATLRPDSLQTSSLKQWHRAAVTAMKDRAQI